MPSELFHRRPRMRFSTANLGAAALASVGVAIVGGVMPEAAQANAGRHLYAQGCRNPGGYVLGAFIHPNVLGSLQYIRNWATASYSCYPGPHTLGFACVGQDKNGQAVNISNALCNNTSAGATRSSVEFYAPTSPSVRPVGFVGRKNKFSHFVAGSSSNDF